MSPHCVSHGGVTPAHVTNFSLQFRLLQLLQVSRDEQEPKQQSGKQWSRPH
eukprot:CAMPEP_0183559108 /NCGR_PEP_ID=MMETSP0371-20130417/90722_1 /TAXON_ID=268820 /ORGANISM="Peridinium aciculiferum, Strain PAER-2" /LENGTH=50 /DNA_ID=CAMNT_0025766793 /DNA_START=221 /DNA_END=373 /DNA_ORIENTATION=+